MPLLTSSELLQLALDEARKADVPFVKSQNIMQIALQMPEVDRLPLLLEAETVAASLPEGEEKSQALGNVRTLIAEVRLTLYRAADDASAEAAQESAVAAIAVLPDPSVRSRKLATLAHYARLRAAGNQ